MLVYLTGATGFLGSKVIHLLKEQGASVTSFGRNATGVDVEEHYSVDLSDPVETARLSILSPPDIVIHLAANVDLRYPIDRDMYRMNVLSSALLADAARQWNAGIVFASTAIVHGVSQETISASTPVNPDTAYGRSKWLAEELIRASGADHCILRLGGIFGAGGPSHLGVNAAIDRARNGLPPTVNDAGSAFRSYIFVEDAAAAVVHAATHSVRGTHLIAGTPPRRIEDLLQAICDRFLPGHSPLRTSGGVARDQIVVPSPAFPDPRSFDAALASIR